MNLRPFLLKVAATVVSLAATAASAAYVTAHVKNQNAPLKPTVLASTSIRPVDVSPVTSTYAS